MRSTSPGHGFVGRSVELAQLEDAYSRVRDADGSTIIVGGEAGAGKSRLVRELLDRPALAGAGVLSGACLELAEAAPPYGPFVEALRGLVAAEPPERLPALLGPWRTELARVLPELEPRVPRGAPAEFDRTGQARLFEIILGVVERVAGRAPTVLVVEDVHWADRSTRDLLAFLVHNLRSTAVLVVITVRSDALGRDSDALQFLAALQRDDHVTRIELRAMGRDELSALVADRTGAVAPAGTVDALLARTSGNPFFAEQLLQAPGLAQRLGDLPPRLNDVLRARVAAMPAATRDILRAASAAGLRTDDALLEAVLDLPGPAVARALREAIDAGILEPAPVAAGVADGRAAHGGYVFHHALLREVVYEELLPAERRRLHAVFADRLTERGEVGGVPVAAADLAYHWNAAGDAVKTVPAAVEAGRAAEAAFAFAEASAWYDRALEAWAVVPDAPRLAGADRVTLLQRAAEAHVLAGDHAGAIRLGREAVGLAVGEHRDPLRLGHLHDRLRWFQWDAGDHDGAAASLHDALSVIPADPPTTVRARALAQLAGVEMHAGRFEAAADAALRAIEVARAAGGRGEEALALGVLGWVTALRGDPEHGIRLYREGLAIAEELRGVEGIALGYAELARMLDGIGRPEESLAAARDGFTVTSRLGLERTYGGLLLGHAINALLDLGRWDEARAALDTALRTGYTGRPALWIRINEARLETGRGDLVAAAAAIQAARALHEGLHGSELRPRLLAGIAELGVARGDVAEVRAAWDEAWSQIQPDALPDPAAGWLGSLALRAEADELERATIHRDDEARAVVIERLARIATILTGVDETLRRLTGDAPREPRLVAIEATCRAEVARARDESASDRWAAATVAWDVARRPAPAAYTRLRLAESSIADRERRAVGEAALREGHAVAGRLGAAPLRARFEELARRARIDLGGEPGSTDPGAREAHLGLTPRELEILLLVAGGWSNQQIADRLFISRKTASVHVSNILGKLGVDRREEAAAVAHRVGLGRDTPPPPGSEPVA